MTNRYQTIEDLPKDEFYIRSGDDPWFTYGAYIVDDYTLYQTSSYWTIWTSMGPTVEKDDKSSKGRENVFSTKLLLKHLDSGNFTIISKLEWLAVLI